MVEQILHSLSQFLPEAALAVAFCLTILVSLIVRKQGHVAIPVSALLGVGVSLFFVLEQSGVSQPIFSGMMVVDPFSVFFKTVIACSSILIILFSLFSAEVRSAARYRGEYYSLLLALTLGMYLMAGAANLLMMILALELASLTSYVLAGYTKDAGDSSEASLKYIIYGALSSGLMLYGVSILYGLTGATDIYGVNKALSGGEVNEIALLVASILIIAGFGYKISAVPFHFWTPDVYEGAPVTITAFLSVASKAAGFAMMIRFFKVSFIDSSVLDLPEGMWASLQGFEWNNLFAVLSVLTMTLGNLVAVWQNNLKRLLAYSSIAHAGYMLMGVVVLSDKGIAAVLIYFVVYLFMNLGAFLVVMMVANKTGSEDIDSYKGLGYRSPLIGVAMVVFFISLTGLPPTAGFIGKLYLFVALLDARWIWLAIVGALNSVVSLYYYIRVLRNMFLRDPEKDSGPLKFSVPQVALLLVLLLPTLLLGLYFAPLVDWANASVLMFGVR
ncbi:MAG: NADH-quinone oxidoreductase subunit N [Ignavibacteriales bacterium]|nr:NADH-quinone oxidoreductase subunit N [Ignavibacteriales bacterium]